MNCRGLFRCVWLVLIVGMTIGPAAGVIVGQSPIGRLAITGQVSGVVSLALSPNFQPRGNQIVTGSDAGGLTLSLSGADTRSSTSEIPVLVRSNTGFLISALVRSQDGAQVNVYMVNARSTGRFADPAAAANLKLNSALGTNLADSKSFAAGSVDEQFSILSGPRVSLAGTLSSPDNALEVTLLIVVAPDAATKYWHVDLTLSGNPDAPR